MQRSSLLIVLGALLLAAATGHAGDEVADDILGRALGEVGYTREDLGYEPQGYWNRFPLDIPHKLSSFDALFAEPLRLVDYATVMANTVELYLDPDYADSTDGGLYKLVYNLGVDKRQGGFRSYSANLRPAPEGDEPLVAALEEVFALGGKSSQYRTFGAESGGAFSPEELRERLAALPNSARATLAQLVVNLVDAIQWRQTAFRNCDPADMEKAFRIRDLADTQSDGQVYYPEFDDLATTIDWPSLYYAALKVAAATETAERALAPLAGQIPDEFEIEMATPYGKIIILSASNEQNDDSSIPSSLPGYGNDAAEIDASNSLLIVDFGRDVVYQGTPGATHSLSNPISVVLDLGGDDCYGDSRASYQPNAGVGFCGVGLVLDRSGDDRYTGSVFAQGAGLFGAGILLDRAGNDVYTAELSAQGCGYFGFGMCFDATGKDKYYLWGDGQGFGGVGGGVGVCASFDGDDEYTAEPWSDVVNRGDYHSDHKVNGNSAQGAGFGRRGDGSDGHSWAGGLGAIIDIHGNDEYLSGNWTLGVGYWFATGIAVDRTGNDCYESCYFTQGSGAHYCNGILLDEGGNDRHELFETAGAALGFGWDYANSLLVNKGGNDRYRAKMISMGLAQIRSCAFLIDIGGDDEYRLGEGTPGLGEATFRADYDRPSQLTPYYFYAKSFGGFIDIGGDDKYLSFTDSTETPHPTVHKNTLWLQPARSDSTFGANNFGVGIDSETGTIPELFWWDE